MTFAEPKEILAVIRDTFGFFQDDYAMEVAFTTANSLVAMARFVRPPTAVVIGWDLREGGKSAAHLRRYADVVLRGDWSIEPASREWHRSGAWKAWRDADR